MSVADQINRIKTNIANAYSAAEAKGATIPEVKNSENLSACVDSITAGGGTQFGLTAEQVLGTLVGEGNLILPTLPSITFSGLKSMGAYRFYYKFYQRTFEDGASVSFPDLTSVGTNSMYSCFAACTSLTTVDLSSLTSMDNNGMYSCFAACTSLTTVDLSSLTSVGTNSMYSCFTDCTSLTTVDLSSLTSMDNNGMTRCFLSCTSLTTVDLSSLTSIGYNGMTRCFEACSSLTSISFPSLTSVQTDSFGGATYNYCFYGCTALTEIHFRADMQATIEAMTGYADKWGASGATIYFSL